MYIRNSSFNHKSLDINEIIKEQEGKEHIRDGDLNSFSKSIRSFIRKVFMAKFLVHRLVQLIIVLLFIINACFLLLYQCPKASLGLDPTDPIEKQFYLHNA